MLEWLGIRDVSLYVTSCILLNLTPGQDTLYILGRTLSQGRRAGLMSVAGIIHGCLIHTLLSAAGLSAVLAAYPAAYWGVKLSGAAYLAYLGWQLLRSPPNQLPTGQLPSSQRDVSGPSQPESAGSIYRSGLVTNLLNPKVSLFFLAFLPQFLADGTQGRFVPFLVLGCIFATTGTIWCLILVWAASQISRRLRQNGATSLWGRRATGLLFLLLGVRLALTSR